MNSTPSDEPPWKQRAVERSIRTVRVRAEQRVDRFLDAAQAIISEKGTTDFTVQEVVDRARQSLRSFYLQFDGKNDLLLALFEDALNRSANEIRTAADERSEPLARLEVAVKMLFEQSRPEPSTQRPLFTEFAPQLLISHPAAVKGAHTTLLALLTEFIEEAAAAGQLRAGVNPRRLAAMTMQTVMFTAQAGGAVSEADRPITADEVWTFCSRGFTQARRPA